MVTIRPKQERRRQAPRPLDEATLNELALAYLARFATSAARLERYLQRKLRERGWDGAETGEGAPDPAKLVRRFVELGYIDDEGFARMRAGDLLRRGYGGRRVNQALGQAGIAHAVAQAVAPGERRARTAAVQLARKRGFGPFAREPLPPEKREKAIAAMLRAGHKFDHARAVLDAEGELALQDWIEEAAEDEDHD